MDTELYIRRPQQQPANTNTNNNSPAIPRTKRWSTSGLGLERLEEGVEGPPGPDTDTVLSVSAPPSGPGARRKSWHVGKLDRKRRKGPEGGQDHRQKRHSWWTVFLPENFSNRSRRSSTDVGRTVDHIPWVRSKSRSVDHGFVAPFDLDSLRDKVEGRFESTVDRLAAKDGETDEGGGGSKDGIKMHKSTPPKTITYKVEANDTLTSIAAHFDTTPSELAILNRLASRTVFPGQVIRVPEKKAGVGAAAEDRGGGGGGGAPPDPTHQHHQSAGTAPPAVAGDEKTNANGDDDEETAILDKLRVASPKPGHVERICAPQSPSLGGGSGAGRQHQQHVAAAAGQGTLERFLKICVRHITDGQGVVSGVLLVTPNAVMFDPNVSDPLVIEQGPESYGVIAPMEYVVNAAIYHDIAHMRVGNSDRARPDLPKPEVYRLKCSGGGVESSGGVYRSTDDEEEDEGEGGASLLTANQGDSLDSGDPHHSPSAREDSLLAKDETFPELRSSTDEEEEEEEEDGGSRSGSGCSCSGIQRDGAAFPKAFERDLVTPTNLLVTSTDKLGEGEEERAAAVCCDADTDTEVYGRSLEERRKSSLDHHWAVPSKPQSLEETSFQNRDEGVGGEGVGGGGSVVERRRGSEGGGVLVKLSCHDSGIDIRDPMPPPRKTVYSDADVLLSGRDEFIPPIPVQPIHHQTDATCHRKKASSVSFSLDEEPTMRDKPAPAPSATDAEQRQETKKNKMIKRLSYPLSWMEGIVGQEKDEKETAGGGSSLPSSADSHTPSSSSQHTTTPSSSSHSHSSVFSKVFSRRSSVGTFIRQQNQQNPLQPPTAVVTGGQKSTAPKLDYRSMVSVDDMPELFVSFDKLIPRPAKSFEDPPLYLRLRMGKPMNKRIPKSTPVMSYGKKKMRPEYWFSVPRERVDDLYRFLVLWVPHLYGDLVEEAVHERGYELVDSDTELWENEADAGGGGGEGEGGKPGRADQEVGDLTRESWEVLSMSEELRRALYASSAASLDLDLSLPDLNGVTEILTEEHRKQLCRHLPARAEGYVWTLVFSTSQHGFSLNSMYRKMNRIESPILLVIQDTESNVFGGLTSCALKVSDHFYGTGESLLYRFSPEFQVYNWTGDNMYFIKGNNESLSIGAGDGKFGLWLDGDLNQGRTEPCNTYGNEPLTPSKDFVVKTLECWAFV